MKTGDNRIEPIFEEHEQPGQSHESGPPPFDPEPEQQQVRTAIRLAAIVVVATCLFFVGDRLYIHYQARQAVKALEQDLEALRTYMTESLDQAGAAMEQANRQARARTAAAVKQQRSQRMATTEGGWLGNNCADWTRSWNQTRAQTSEQEMKKHCGRYEHYLATGIAPPGTPRAVNRMR